MNLQLRNKLEDFTVWTVLSFEHFQAKRFADALTNMRKAGEAASKLIIFYNFSNTVSELKIAQKGYKELINQLIADNLVPRKMINWLETFQIHGNIATHDNKVAQIQAEYGNIALKLLVSWLFQEYLKTEIPLTMQHFIAQEQDTEQLQQQAKVLISSLDEAKINVAKLEKELQTKQQSLEHTEALKKDLKTAVSKVKELEASQQKISSLRGELQKITLEKEQLKIELEKAKQERTISVEPLPEKSVSKGKKKIVFAGLMGILLLVCIIFIYKYYPFNAASLSSTKENNSSFKVLILPFSVMQSNLNLTVKIEEKIRERLIEKSEAEKISVEVLYRPEKDKSILTYKQASQIAKMQNADFIVFGNINEQESGGSVHATIKYSFNYKNDNFFLDTLMSFEQLSINSADIKEEKLQNKTNNITDIAIACNLILNKKNYTDALLFLNKTDAVSKKQDVIALQLLARCYIMTNNYPKAKNIMEKLQKIYPDNIYILRYLIGIVSDGEQKYNEAEKLIQKGLALDAENIDLMVDYANLLYSIYKQFIQAKTYALKAVQKDSTNARAQYALAIILDTYFNDYKNAYVHYLKTVELNPQNNIAKRKVGEILAFELNEPEKGVTYLYEVLKTDSNDYITHHLIGKVFINTSFNDINKAEKYFLISQKLQGTNVMGETYSGLGLVAFNKGKYQEAEKNFLSAMALGITNANTYSYLCKIYEYAGNCDEMK